MKKTLIYLLAFFCISIVNAQVAINTTGANPDASAGLDVSFTDKGALIPRVSLTQTTSSSPITSPAISLLVYNTATVNDVTPGYYYWTGSAWSRFATGTISVANLTFNNSGTGAASGTTYNGTTAQTISYNTIGAVGGSGTATRVAFWSGANTLSSNTNLYWDNTNSRLGIGTTTPVTTLDVSGIGRFGLSTNGNTQIGNDGNAYIEMKESDGIGTPYIDMSNDNTSDYDARIVLENNNQLSFLTSTNGRQLSIHGTGIALSGTNKYMNFGSTFDAPGYGFRDNAGIIEYKHSGGTWTPFAQPPTIPGNTEWWIRPTSALYIQPMYNASARVYDAGQTYGFYFDGSTNQYAAYFRTTGAFNPTAAVVGFSDVSGNQTYSFLGYNGTYSFAGQTINGSGIYAYVDDPDRTAGFFRTTLNASFAANINYSNVWIANYNYVENSSATYNPSGSYSQLDLTNTTLGGNHVATKGYSNRATTTGNPGYTVGGQFTANAQYEDAFGITGIAYTDQTIRAGGYFASYNYAGTQQAYAYVGTTADGTARKITGTNSVSEIIPTENHGRIMLTCPESPEYWYIDYGSVQLKNGKAYIELDPVLADVIVVNNDNPIRVFCTPVDMLNFNGIAVTKRTEKGIELTELNGGQNSGTLDYQLVVKPKTNYGEGRFPQAPGPMGLKADKEPLKAKAKNQPDANKIFHWPSDQEVYGYSLPKIAPESAKKK